MSEDKRKTRLKGTENQKPCFECGKTKDRFKDFKPRWAGCITHRTDRGRRYHKPGCAECEKVVNGNIRQPRCIECDKGRPKKAADAPTTEQVVIQPGPQVEAALKAEATGVVEVASVEPAEPEVQAAAVAVVLPEVKAEPVVAPVVEPAPVVVATPEPEAAPAPEALPVVVTPPAAPAPAKKKLATKADLFALFATDEEPKSEDGGPF